MITKAEAEAREVWAAAHLREVNNLGALLMSIGGDLRGLYGQSPPMLGCDDDLRDFMADLDRVVLTPILDRVRAFNTKVAT